MRLNSWLPSHRRHALLLIVVASMIPAISAVMLRMGLHSPLAHLLWEVAIAGSLALSIVILPKALCRRVIILKV